MSPAKPRILYHGSIDTDLTVVTPHAESVRDKKEGQVIFASPRKGIAAVFMVRWQDDWVRLGRFGRGPYHLVISDKARWKRIDRGGAIYSLPSQSFTTDPSKGLGTDEWISRKPVKPQRKVTCRTALAAIRADRIQVYFVSKRDFAAIEASDDDGRKVLRRYWWRHS